MSASGRSHSQNQPVRESLPIPAWPMPPCASCKRARPSFVAIGWTDAAGEVVAHSYDNAPPRSNISDMSHFIAQRDSADDGLFIAPPYRSAAGDKWFTAASRRLSNADGSFAGIVTAPLDQSYFTKLYRSIDLGKGGSILLLHRDGQLLARRARDWKDAIGRSLANGPLLTRTFAGIGIGVLRNDKRRRRRGSHRRLQGRTRSAAGSGRHLRPQRRAGAMVSAPLHVRSAGCRDRHRHICSARSCWCGRPMPWRRRRERWRGPMRVSMLPWATCRTVSACSMPTRDCWSRTAATARCTT